jgi:acylphosphatase
VEAVFEGEEPSLAAMKALCSEGPALARVDRVVAEEAPGSGEWDTFTIRYG